LQNRLTEVAAVLGPLPHASLHIEQAPLTAVAVAVDRPKKQRARMLKAECPGEGCGYTLRVAAKWVRDLGPPHCPKHGAMSVDLPPESEGAAEPEESVFKRSLPGIVMAKRCAARCEQGNGRPL
jgi:hypothetical protein